MGLFLSSLHQPLAHTGEIAYPDYFLDNNLSGPNPNGNAPKIELSVTILDDGLAGDFSGDGSVDAASGFANPILLSKPFDFEGVKAVLGKLLQAPRPGF